MHSSLRFHRVLFPAGFVWLAAPGFAQAVAAPSTSPADPAAADVVSLTAFQVSSDKDVGYTASSALAGGRIDTPLRETPSVVTVITKEFLEDIAATSIMESSMWAPNSVPNAPFTGSDFADYNVNTRGIGSSFPTRNYFRWYVPSDNYNTERLEFARGPNSILFGDANPGGVITTWTKQALFRPLRSAQLRTDSFGGYRASFDYNLPAGDRLAVRVNALHDRLQGLRDDDKPQRDGGHVAVTFRLTRETQVRAEYEQGNLKRYNFAQNFSDQSSNWNRTAVYNGVTAPSTTGTGVSRLNTTATDDYLVYIPALGPAAGLMNWRGFYQTTGSGLRLLPEGRDINNFPVLPSRKFNLQPPESYLDNSYKTLSVYLEHQFKAGLIAQAAFNNQVQRRWGITTVWTDHRIDVNTVLPTGAPNPNFGRAYADAQPIKQVQGNRLTDYRLSLAYRKEWRWLRESLSVMTGQRTDEYNPYSWRANRVGGTNPTANAATNILRVRQYWGGPRVPALFETLSVNGAQFALPPITASDEDQNLFYSQVASASSFFQGKLSLLLGYRYDRFKRQQQRNVASNPDGTPIMGATDGIGTFDRKRAGVGTRSAGAVWFPVPWIGAFANFSESFNSPGNGANLIDGGGVPTSSNQGYDAGLKLEFFGGKISGTLSYYENEQLDRPRTGDNTAQINEIWNDLGRPQDEILAYRDTESYRAHGVELALTANPTRNLRLMANYSVPKTAQADIGPGLRSYYARHLATWQAGAANPALPNAARIATDIATINRTIQGYTQNRTLNNTVDYTANVYATYSFREGRLKGFALGGGANFRGRMVIGNVNGQPFNYLYAAPYALVSSHASFETRFGKTRVRLQLNLTNLLNEQDVLFQTYTTVGGIDRPNTFSYQTPRKAALSATFNF